MNPFWQPLTIALAQALLPTFAVLIGMMANRYQLESLRNEIKAEFRLYVAKPSG
jgi:hypothetical protein